MKPFIIVAATIIFSLHSGFVKADGLIRTVWSCEVPCVSEPGGDLLAVAHVNYCGISALSRAMIKSLTPVCQRKTKRTDVVAARLDPGKRADCISSSNVCAKDGLVNAGFTCSYMCPSEDDVIHKFTACAATADDAWIFVTKVCKDATAPDKNVVPPAKVCIAEGQTPCE